MAGIVRDILDILRNDGLRKGGSILVGRAHHRLTHAALVLADLPELFLQYRLYRQKALKSGRRLVCIALIEHMGDIVACQPVAVQVRNEEPDALILWCVKRSYAEIVTAFSEIDGVITLGCLSSWIALRKWGRFDRVVDLHINGRICLICQIPLEKEEGARQVNMENYYSHGSLLQVFSQSAGLSRLNAQPVLTVPDNVKLEVDDFSLSERTVVIHCCSNESCRDWKNERWNALIDVLQQKYKVMVIEIGSCSPLEREDSEGYRNLCGRCSILQSAELIRRSMLFVGVDSGPAHLANAVDTPGVVLLGDYLAFRNYTPYTGGYADGTRADLIRSPGNAELIMLDEVVSAASFRIDSSVKGKWSRKF